MVKKKNEENEENEIEEKIDTDEKVEEITPTETKVEKLVENNEETEDLYKMKVKKRPQDERMTAIAKIGKSEWIEMSWEKKFHLLESMAKQTVASSFKDNVPPPSPTFN